MNADKLGFFTYRVLPARLTVVEAGWLLGFGPKDITVLVSQGLLKPVGQPTPNATKYFCSVEVEALRTDAKWINRASALLYRYWRTINAQRDCDDVALTKGADPQKGISKSRNQLIRLKAA
jgi:hypothetical protein